MLLHLDDRSLKEVLRCLTVPTGLACFVDDGRLPRAGLLMAARTRARDLQPLLAVAGDCGPWHHNLHQRLSSGHLRHSGALLQVAANQDYTHAGRPRSPATAPPSLGSCSIRLSQRRHISLAAISGPPYHSMAQTRHCRVLLMLPFRASGC